MIIREARSGEEAFLAEACVQIFKFMRQGEQDKFIEGFPAEVTGDLLTWAGSHLTEIDRVAFVAESSDGHCVACILGHIEPSSLPMAVSDPSGRVSVCWVSAAHQRKGIARLLLEALQAWFAKRGITHLEVAYMTKNTVARDVWSQLGFTPFRTFAYKEIDGASD